MTPKKEEKRIRTRFAPSPTGPLHIGGVRTALFNYLFARKNKGDLVLRIEDTDKERSKPEWEAQLMESLEWFGLNWDEGPMISEQQKIDFGNHLVSYAGSHAPYRQSERTEIYKKYLQKLLDSGQAYFCFCTKEELDAQKQYLMSIGEPPVYQGQCCDLPKEKVSECLNQGKKCVIRFKTPEGLKISFNDLIRGKIEFDSDVLGDFVIAKDLENPLYNFTCAVDDAEMEISHVIRGEDHISNTPKQIVLIRALGFAEPVYAHLPLILNAQRKKLSKREGKTSVTEYIEDGYLPEALINFIVLLGWNPGTEREMFSMDELVGEFSLEKIQKAGAVFNLEKLDWLNGVYLRKKNLKDLAFLCIPYLEKAGFIENVSLDLFRIKETKEEVSLEWLEKVVSLYHERLKKLNEIIEFVDYFFKKDLDYPKELLRWKEMSDKQVIDSLNTSLKIISGLDDFKASNLQDVLFKEAEKTNDRGSLLWPLRASLTGKKSSAGPMEIAETLGREKTMERIKKAIRIMENE
ncbi:MAG: glutamate--tRNA ligase [Candidatus Pacebacteria bacterium]|nr:glutamate--tRNA ligase [Candidatus Paceibacterota bacterium]